MVAAARLSSIAVSSTVTPPGADLYVCPRTRVDVGQIHCPLPVSRFAHGTLQTKKATMAQHSNFCCQVCLNLSRF